MPEQDITPPNPACCHAPEGASLGHRFYAAYNRGGTRPGLNFQGNPCPVWEALPEDVRAKWEFVAALAQTMIDDARDEHNDRCLAAL